MKKLLITAFSCFVVTLIGLAQVIQEERPNFYYCDRSDFVLSRTPMLHYGSHMFGDEAARKFAVLKNLYTFVDPASDAASRSVTTTVLKPSIFHSINRLNNYFRKEVRRANLDMNVARQKLISVLDIGLSVYDQPTASLEAELREAKKPCEIIAVFDRVILK